MAWESFNDIYVPNTGGSIEGDLEVSGNLTVNDGSGNGTTYDVASEITDLKDAWDSVSHVETIDTSALSSAIGGWFGATKIGRIVSVSFWGYAQLDAWDEKAIGTLPNPVQQTIIPVAIQGNSHAGIYLSLNTSGQLVAANKSDSSFSQAWMFGSGMYIMAE